jgi:hypothetical protein
MHGRRLFASGALMLALVEIAWGSAPSGSKLLKAIGDKLEAVRSLPEGSAPKRPSVQLDDLIGIDRADVRHELSDPDCCGNDDSLYDPDADCAISQSWSYRWGSPPPELKDGPGWIEVGTGPQPWLLVFNFSDNRVIAVRWQGQR